MDKPISAIEQAARNRCSALASGKCANGFAIKPYCIGTLHPERTQKRLWPDCLRDD